MTGVQTCALPISRRSSDLKQKTAYEITYGDWSSDVCSSDLADQHRYHLILARGPPPQLGGGSIPTPWPLRVRSTRRGVASQRGRDTVGAAVYPDRVLVASATIDGHAVALRLERADTLTLRRWVDVRPVMPSRRFGYTDVSRRRRERPAKRLDRVVRRRISTCQLARELG